MMASIMHNIVTAIFILCSLHKESLSARLMVISAPSVVATFGSDVLLPCHLTPEMNAENMEIRWFKPMYQPYVHLYINGKDDYTAQMPQFANRTELLKENITRGIFPLMIRKVTAQDSGKYYCFVESTEHHGRTTVQLQVNVLSDLTICSHKKNGVSIPCDQESQDQPQSQKKGAVGSLPKISSVTYDTVYCESCDWYPEPHLTWTDKGNKIIPSMEKVFKDEKSLYCIISAIYLPPTSNITCSVTNSLNRSKEISWETREKGLPKTCWDQYSPYIIFWPCLVVLIVCIGCIYHRKKLSNGNRGAEESARIVPSDGVTLNQLNITSAVPVTADRTPPIGNEE